ncbi:MAG: glycosyltransferase [Bacteroidetes bacterium]|nr:glycosyltransferase [Bacteroidota bacterium]
MNTPDYKDFLNSVLCVIVIFKVKLIESSSFVSILKILDKDNLDLDFLIYDNSPTSKYDVNKEKYQHASISYIHNKENVGVSKAYNEGYKLAQKQNKKWLLIMDQDTICPDNFLKAYYYSFVKFQDVSLFVPKLIWNNKVLSPCNFLFERGSAKSHISNGIQDFKKKSLLNSGMFIKLDSFSKTGGFNNKIKLDFSDFYFINNFKKNYNSFVITEAICVHELSSTDTNCENAINRFKFYCNGARNYMNFNNFFWVFLWAKLHMLKLSFKYKDIRFFKIFFKYLIKNNQ